MIEPTKISLDEAAVAAGFNGWTHMVGTSPYLRTDNSVRAHALTLDQLHGRKHPEPVDPLLIEARDICVTVSHHFAVMNNANSKRAEEEFHSGRADNMKCVPYVVAALRKAAERAAPVPVSDEKMAVKVHSCSASSIYYWMGVARDIRNAGFIIIAAPHGDA